MAVLTHSLMRTMKATVRRGLRAVPIALFLVTPALAQDGGATPAGPAAPSAAAQQPLPDMKQPAPGDRWTYEVTDEISGQLKLTRTDMITEVTKDDIAVRFDVADTGRSGNVVYDRSWDVVRTGTFKYTPNDGTGIRLPLTVGEQWKFVIDVANTRNGSTFKRTGVSKVLGRESVVTKAGTFDAFVIETDFTGRNIQDPTLVNQTTWRTWFDPAIDHWVKRSIMVRQRGHVVSSDTAVLTACAAGKR